MKKIKVKIPRGYIPYKYNFSMTSKGGEIEIVCMEQLFVDTIKKALKLTK